MEHDRSIEPFHLVAERQAGEERWTRESPRPIEKLERPADGPGQGCCKLSREKFERATGHEWTIDSEERQDDREERQVDREREVELQGDDQPGIQQL